MRHRDANEANEHADDGGHESPFRVPVHVEREPFGFLFLFSKPANGELTFRFLKTAVPNNIADRFAAVLLELCAPLHFSFGVRRHLVLPVGSSVMRQRYHIIGRRIDDAVDFVGQALHGVTNLEVVASTAKVAIFERRTFKTTQSAKIAFPGSRFPRTTPLC